MTAADQIRRWVESHRRVFVLTGEGCSTASGIPDYRDENGEWKRRPPVMIQAFRTDPAVYRRYWARACVVPYPARSAEEMRRIDPRWYARCRPIDEPAYY